MGKIIAIYARQSKFKEYSDSIESQIDECKKRLTAGELERLKTYSDKGKSGKDIDRPEMKKLITDIENNLVEKVVVYRIDRISRNIADLSQLVNKMKSHNCEFFSAGEGIDTSSEMGETMAKLIGIFGELERKAIIQRVTDSYYRRINEGKWPGGPAPLGFKIGRTENNSPTLTITEENKKIIKKAFEDYLSKPGKGKVRLSLSDIGDFLFKSGLRSTRSNGRFDNVAISRMFKNPVYAVADNQLANFYKSQNINVESAADWDGNTSAYLIDKKVYDEELKQRKYTKAEKRRVYRSNFPGFIDSYTFIKVQERLAENKQIARSNTATSRLREFSGKLKCGKCGYAIKVYNVSKDGTPNLDCYGRVALHSCSAQFHTQGDPYYTVTLQDIRREVSQSIAAYYSLLKFSYDERKKETKKLIAKKDDLVKKSEEVFQSALSETIKNTPVAQKYNEEYNKMYEKISELDSAIKETAALDTLEVIKNLNFLDLSITQRKAVIDTLIDKIFVYPVTERGMYIPCKVIWKKEISEKYNDMYNKIYEKLSENEKRRHYYQTISVGEVSDEELEKLSPDNILKDLKKYKLPGKSYENPLTATTQTLGTQFDIETNDRYMAELTITENNSSYAVSAEKTYYTKNGKKKGVYVRKFEGENCPTFKTLKELKQHYMTLIKENIKRLKIANHYNYPGICNEKFTRHISDSKFLVIRVTYDVTDEFECIPKHEETYSIECRDDREFKNVISKCDIENLSFKKHDDLRNHYNSLADELFKKEVAKLKESCH